MAEPELWLRGPATGVAPLLQPVADSLLQCRNEVHATVPLLAAQVWGTTGRCGIGGSASCPSRRRQSRPAVHTRAASSFHHQREALRAKAGPTPPDEAIQSTLVTEFDAAVERALDQLRTTWRRHCSTRALSVSHSFRRPYSRFAFSCRGAHAASRRPALVTTAKIVRG